MVTEIVRRLIFVVLPKVLKAFEHYIQYHVEKTAARPAFEHYQIVHSTALERAATLLTLTDH